MTKWIHRHYIFTPEANYDKAKDLAARINPSGFKERKTFSVQLSGNGTGNPTYRACNTAATDEMFEALKDSVVFNEVPGLIYYHVEPDGFVLKETNSETAINKIGEKFLFDDALSDLGIKTLTTKKFEPEEIWIEPVQD